MGSKTLNDIFYKPDIGASGAVEKGKFDDGLDDADILIESNKPVNNKLSAFAVTTSEELAGVISDKTGSGALVFETALNDRTTQTTEDYTIYCNASTGNDITGDGTSGNPYATIQKCIDMLPTIIAHNVIIAVGADETVTTAISFAGHYCGKSLTLKAMDISDNNLYFSGTATGGSATTLTQTGAGWAIDFWNGGYVFIWKGTGVGEVREITNTTSDTITIASGTTPDNTSKYVIVKVTITGSSINNCIEAPLDNLYIQGFKFTGATKYAIRTDEAGSSGTGIHTLDVKYNLIQTPFGIRIAAYKSAKVWECYINADSGKNGLFVASMSYCYIRDSVIKGAGIGVNATSNSMVLMVNTVPNTFIDLATGIKALMGSIVQNGSSMTFVSCSTDLDPAAASDPAFIG